MLFSIMGALGWLLLLVLLVGGIFLQVFLSRRTSKWFGLILPAIAFLYSLLMIFSLAAYAGMTDPAIFSEVASIFLLCNIPTIILLAVYFVCREKKEMRTQLDERNRQGLE